MFGPMFKSLSQGFLELASAIPTIFSYVIATLIVYFLSICVARYAFKCDLTEQLLFGMGAAFSNSVMLGVPIVFAVFGASGIVPLTGIILFNTVILLGGTTLIIEVGERRGTAGSAMISQTLRRVLLNPVIVGILAGLLWGYLNIPVGIYFERVLDGLSGAVLPCGLVALGASVVGIKAEGNAVEIATVSTLKLVAHPIIAWLVASYLLNLSFEARSLVVIVAALPMAGNVFLLAQKYQRSVDRMASSFIVSTSISMVTLAFLIAWHSDHYLRN